MNYQARAGVNWRTADGNEERAEVGEPVPAWVVEGCPWLLRVGAVEEVEERATGGLIASGTPYMVGESGCVIVAPTRAPASRKGHTS